MGDEVLDLLAGGFAQGFGAAEIHRVRLDQTWVQLMLADDLAEAIADSRTIAIQAIAVRRLRREFPGRVVRLAFGLGRTAERSDLLDRANANAIRLPQRAINRASLSDAHLRTVNERKTLMIGIAVTVKTATLLVLVAAARNAQM
jgi:hypothetical protein